MLKVILMAALTIIFVSYVRHIKKEYQKNPNLTKPKWYKLYFEFLIVNIINLVGMWLIFTFGGPKAPRYLLAVFSTSPWLFLILGVAFPIAVFILYYIYGSLRVSKEFFGGVEYLIVFNRLYEILVILNIAAILLKIL